MSDPAAAFSTAQEATLRASAELKAALGGTTRLYRAVPAGAVLPYGVIGEDQIIEAGVECQAGSEIFSTVHFWLKPDVLSDVSPRIVGGIVRGLLNTDLNLIGHRTVEHQFEDMRINTDPDGSTHVRLGFRYLTEPL